MSLRLGRVDGMKTETTTVRANLSVQTALKLRMIARMAGVSPSRACVVLVSLALADRPAGRSR